MSEWKECKVGDIAKSNLLTVDKNYPHKEILYLDTGSITCGRIDSVQSLSLENAPSRAKRLVRESDIIYSTVPPIQRHYGFIKNPAENLVVSTGFSVITADKTKADPLFLYYLLTSDDSVEVFDVIAEASTFTYPSLKPSDIENFDISLPPLPEQKAIAEVLTSLDDKIDLLSQQNKTLEQLAETLFRHHFIDNAQDDWEDGKLGDCVTISYGKNLPTNQLLETGYPVFGGNGQIGFFDKFLYADPQVLVSCRGEASGKVNISLPNSFVTNNSLVLVRDKKPEISFEFLKYFALNYDFSLHVSGSAQPQITIDGLYDAEFVMPSSDLIKEYSNVVGDIEEKRLLNFYQIKNLEKLRDQLLPRLMSGEITKENL